MKYLTGALCALALGSCALGPNYKRPELSMPAAFKEAEGWKISAPQDDADRGAWWEVYGDPVLNDLVSQVMASNQNIRAFEASYRAATASLNQSRASFFPVLTGSAGWNRSERGIGGAANQFSLSAGASWELDVWGRIRRSVEASGNSAMASKADLANATLSAQAALVTAYFEIRIVDELKRLLEETVAGYQESFQIAQNKYNQGTVSKADVAQAEAQYRGTQSQIINTTIQRAQLEHAIAVLVGKAPAEFGLAPVSFDLPPPEVPIAVPSALLERRPDVASAERRVAAANAQIGVAISGYFPDLSLRGSAGYSGSTLENLTDIANRTWSLGPSLAMTIFNFGATNAQIKRAEAAYDQTVAQYRNVVLNALADVEDELINVRLLSEQSVIQRQAVEAAREAQRITRNAYREGTRDFTAVVTSQATALGSEQTALNIRRNQLTATVRLIQAMGGGWAGLNPPEAAQQTAQD